MLMGCSCIYFNMFMVTYTHTKEYYSSGERRNMLFVTTWMDFEGIMLSEIADDR